jgi:hypothetical protein
MTLAIIERKGLNVVNTETLVGEAGDAINDNFYTIGDRLETLESSPTFTGDVAFSGDVQYLDTFWDDERVPITSTKLGGSKDPGFEKAFASGASQGVFTYFFDPSSEEELYFPVQLPHCWKEGTNIHPHVHWFPKVSGTSGQKVGWGLEYTWADIGQKFSDTETIFGDQHVPTGDTTLEAGKHYLTPLGEINGSGYTLSSMLLCRIFRDATSSGSTDNYAGDAGLMEVDFHIEKDRPGSREEYIK